MLDQVRMGDQVKFNVEELNGAMTVAALGQWPRLKSSSNFDGVVCSMATLHLFGALFTRLAFVAGSFSDAG